MSGSSFPNIALRQGWVAFLAMASTVALTSIDPALDPLADHMSEAVRTNGLLAASDVILTSIAGASVMIFGAGCFWARRSWSWTGLTALLFGSAMIANGIFPAGSPLHGLYGLALFSVLVPVGFAAEFAKRLGAWFREFSLFASVVGLAYMWILLVGLDPEGWQGLTQRVASLLAFGWFAVCAYHLRSAVKS